MLALLVAACGVSRRSLPPLVGPPVQQQRPETGPERTRKILQEADERISAASRDIRASQIDLARSELEQAAHLLTQAGPGVSEEADLFAQYAALLRDLEKAQRGITRRSPLPDIEESPALIFLRSLDDSTLSQVSAADINQALEAGRLARSCDVPIDYNYQTARSIRLFQTSLRSNFSAWLARSGRYLPLIQAEFSSRGLPKDLAYLALVESGYNPVARSPANAVGMWQFIESAARVFDLRMDRWVDERMDPVKATVAAGKYLGNLYDRLGDWRLALASYNWGRLNVERAIERAGTRDYWALNMPRETVRYVPLFMAATLIAKNPEAFGFGDVRLEPPLSYEEVVVSEPVDLALVAECAKLPVSQVAALNSELILRRIPPGDRSYRLKLPQGCATAFGAAYAALPPERKTTLEYTVRKGDNVRKIARRFGTTEAALLAANGMREARKLRPGDRIRLPSSPPTRDRTVTSAKQIATRSEAATSDTVFHTVRKGETIRKISNRYGETIGAIAALNGLNPKHYTIYPGDRLAVKVATSPVAPNAMPQRVSAPQVPVIYTVKQGDTMWSIAQNFSVGVGQIAEWNGISTPASLKEGHKLKIWSSK